MLVIPGGSVQSVTIAELKSNLSSYLRRVRSGEEILVCDRAVPIGKIVPLARGESIGAEEMELAAAGVLKLPDVAHTDLKRSGRGARIASTVVLDALDHDRDE